MNYQRSFKDFSKETQTRKVGNHLYRFGSFQLEPEERRLLHDGELVSLTPKAFDTLVYLVERAGHLVEKEDLMEALWPDSFVEEANLSQYIWTLRKTLGHTEDG
jgi:DNA-binding winged helix-turn-helix (wHTH) protein